MTKIVFMGTSDFAVSILISIYKFGYDVVAIYTKNIGISKDIIYTVSEDLKITLFSPDKFLTKEVIEFIYHKADIGIVVSYGFLLLSSLLSIFPLGCFNIHASLLPNLRGAAPIQRGIEGGNLKSGITIISMDKSLDTGFILLNKELILFSTIESIELYNLLSFEGSLLILELIRQVKSNILSLIVQDNYKLSYANKLCKFEGNIIWLKSAKKIENCVRSFIIWPGSFFLFNNLKFKIIRCYIIVNTKSFNLMKIRKPGQIISIYPFIVTCGEDYLLIDNIQRMGKTSMDMDSFLNGFSISVGNILS